MHFAYPPYDKEGDSYMSIKVIVKFNVKSEKLDGFSTILENVKSDLPRVDGCQGVCICRSITNANQFTLVETWKSKKLHQDHFAKIIEDGVWSYISDHLSTEPESDYYENL
jgi:quinol monooxygenase YgiN